MAVKKCIFLMCILCCFYLGLCQLNLSEGSPCISNEKINGTCVRLFRCGSAVLTYLYRNAGFTSKDYLPEIPEICSYVDNEPVVCCTDCVFSQRDTFTDLAVGPQGILVTKRGPKAWGKCLEYFHKLPYPCHSKGDIRLTSSWAPFNQCHHSKLNIKVAVGGRTPQPWKFPHVASLGYGDTVADAQWMCEGTVISERFILTAAHCTNGGVFGTIAYAALGLKNNAKNSVRNGQREIYNIKRVIIHPEYNEPSWYNNIALLETETEIRFDKDILPACLDIGFQDISIAEAAGISNIFVNMSAANETDSSKPKTVFLGQLNGEDCFELYEPNNNLIRGYDYNTQVCYGVLNDNGDTCKRIGGSPLQIDQFRCQYTVVGVTGYVEECDSNEDQILPDIFTRVEYYVPWIESIVWPDVE